MLFLASCQEKMIFQLSDDKGYVDQPFVSIEALDGDRWIKGQVDQDTKTILFEFHTQTDLSAVPIKVTLNGKWPRMVSPEEPLFTANLTTSFKMTVNDGCDQINYNIEGVKFSLIEKVYITKGVDRVECNVDHLVAEGKFTEYFLYSDLSDVKVEVVTVDDAAVITMTAKMENVDFTSPDIPFDVVINDKVTGRDRTLKVYAKPADVVKLDKDWNDVTTAYRAENGLDSFSSSVRIYTNEVLNGMDGNVAYMMTIPAGMIGMKVLEKSNINDDDKMKISAAVRNNRNYSVFFYMNCPSVWHIDGSSATTDLTYYSPLAYSQGKVLRQEGWGGKANQTMYAPALAIKDGKALIAPAKSDKSTNKLYAYSDASGNGQQDWSDVDCAVGGYFMIVKDGQSLIGGRGDVYQQYSYTWRTFPGYDASGKCLLTNFTTPSWSAAVPITEHDALRIGRNCVAVTERGDLVLLSVKKYLNTHNQGQGQYKGMNGAASDYYGVTLAELADLMAQMGCSAAMTLEDLNWCSFVLQDGGDRGHDLFMVNRRYTFDTTKMKDESNELVNLVIACFN